MKNKYILLEMNQRNEIRADVNMSIKSMELIILEKVDFLEKLFLLHVHMKA